MRYHLATKDAVDKLFSKKTYYGAAPLGILMDSTHEQGEIAPPFDFVKIGYEKPDTNSQIILYHNDYVRSVEYSYEAVGPLVYATTQPNWLNLRFANGADFWIKTPIGSSYRSFEDFFATSHASFLTQHWNGKLHEKPFLIPPSKTNVQFGMLLTDENMKYPYDEGAAIDVKERKKIGDTLWFKVQFVTGDVCEGETQIEIDVKTKKPVEGWIPLRNDTGELNFWFSSRGC